MTRDAIPIAVAAVAQLGTIEAYNRLVKQAEGLKRKIDKGQACAPLDMYLTSVKG